MSEDYRIVSTPRGEPRSADRVGACVRVRLSGCPSRRWARDLGARLTTELAGHAAVGHLRIDVNDIVQGDHIVLDGVERVEAKEVAAALLRAVDAANAATAREEEEDVPNMSQREADAIAREVSVNPGDAGSPAGKPVDERPCPRCKQPVSVTVSNVETGDQLAVERRECPGCGAGLVRNIEGHADRGWRLEEPSTS
jgi:hypothetical protein